MFKKLALALLIGATFSAAQAQAGVRLSIGIGLPIIAPIYPRPVYVAPAPVYVVPAAAPVYVQPATPVYVQPAPPPGYVPYPAYGQPTYVPAPR